MSTQRKITVILTDKQYDALAHAVALADNELDQDGGGAQDRGLQRALRAGWSRINVAWHERAHRAVSDE